MRYKKEGHYRAKQKPGAKRKLDWEAVSEYVKKHPDIMIKRISQNVGNGSIIDT